MDILDRAWLSTEGQHPLPASSVPVLPLDSPEGLGPVALNSQRRRHLDPTSTSPPLPLFPGSVSSERAVASSESGIYINRPPMKMRGGSLPLRPLHLLSARAPHWFLAGGSEEFQLLAKPTCWSARSGPLVRLFGERCVPRPCSAKRDGHNRGARAPSGGGRGASGDLGTCISLLSHSSRAFLGQAGLPFQLPTI